MTAGKIPLPEVAIGEVSVFRPNTAPGLFAYRHFQADNLLHFPDFGDGDMPREQRRAALTNAVEHHQPLSAVVIFLNMVALEDFLRDLGARLAEIPGFSDFFPNASKLVAPRISKPSKPYARLDKEPISSYLDFEKLNRLFDNCLGTRPIDPSFFARLYDLALLRHTIAHHGSIIRKIDVLRFRYFEVRAGHLINPPLEFVKETCHFVYQVGRNFELQLQARVFSKITSVLPPTWQVQPPQILIDLIEVFSYFGKIPQDNEPFPMFNDTAELEKRFREKGERYRQRLIGLCLDDLRTKYGTFT